MLAARAYLFIRGIWAGPNQVVWIRFRAEAVWMQNPVFANDNIQGGEFPTPSSTDLAFVTIHRRRLNWIPRIISDEVVVESV